jgi:4-amino-4-deoxy-L-arabinose transferase-like glycosyltransferase
MTGASRRLWVDPVLWGIVLGGLLVRLIVGLLLPERGFVGDEGEYDAAARVLADGRGFSYYDAAPWLRPPGYPVFLAGLFRLVGPDSEPVRCLQVGLSLLLGPLAAWLGWLVAGRRSVARLAAALTLLCLPLAVFPWLLLTETLFTLLLLAAVGGLAARWHGGGRRWLLLAGLALGGACLLRGLAAGYVGLVALGWLLAAPGARRRRLADVALLLGLVGALIAPWTVRNFVAYRALIPLETTAAYNLWLRGQGGRGESWMLSELRELPDPAARQAHALERGLALMRADPAGYLARGWAELGDVWRLNFGAAERFMAGFSGGEVDHAWLLLSLLLDDGLYLLLLPLAILGLARMRGPVGWLTLGWLGWTCLTALLFFAIVRFRVPCLPLLAVFAAVGLTELGVWWRAVRARRRWAVLTAAGAGGLLLLVLPSLDLRLYAIGWGARPLWERAAAADGLRRAGDPVAALALLEDGPATVPAARLARGLALAAVGRDDAAEAALEPLRPEPRALVALGEVRRLAGDPAGAARLWTTREVNGANPIDWAWGRLNAPAGRVDVGDGLDLGLVRGVWSPERAADRRYRWSDGRAAFRLRAERPGDHRLTAMLRAHRPAGAGPVGLLVVVNGRPVGTWSIADEWTAATLDLRLDGAECVVELISATFVPGYEDPRALGVMVDWVALQPA